MKQLKILILDDEKTIRDNLIEFLSDLDFTVFQAEKPSIAFEILEKEDIDIMILDLMLPEMSGMEVLQKVKTDWPEVEVIMITGHGDMDAVMQAMRYGAKEFFQKPFKLKEIQQSIERSRRFVELNSKLKEVEFNYKLVSKELNLSIGNEIIGTSRAINQVLDLMGKVAKAGDTSVVITGESGTGKELVARGIHYLSDRKNAYFYAVNCSAIPENLFESEFFGHKKGAFTDASEDKAGWFEIANGGTLFLDEIGDMHPGLQSKLLRVLEDRKVRRIGTHKDIDVDVRVIAATNQDLKQLVAVNKFRNDLYYRLNAFEIHIPPLRDRKEDIPMLAEYYINYFSEKLKKQLADIDTKIYKKLQTYDFPGNIRELKNMIEKAMIINDEAVLRIRHFKYSLDVAEEESYTNEEENLDLERMEKEMVSKALDKADFNKSKAAELLNISRQALDRRMEKYGL